MLERKQLEWGKDHEDSEPGKTLVFLEGNDVIRL